MRRCALFLLIALAGALLVVGAQAQEGPLTLEERTASSLTVSWSWSGQTASAWELAWRARGDDDSAAWRSVRKTAAQRRHAISELDAGVHYIIRVRPLDSSDRGLADLRGVFATTQSSPRMLRVTARADTALTLSWAAPTDWTPQGYRLRWRAVGAETALGNLSLPATALSRRVGGLTLGTAYVFRLTALNGRGGESPPQTLTVTAAGEPPATSRISKLSWSGLTIRAEWDSVARATGYDLRWTPEEQRREQLTVSAEREVQSSPAEVTALWTGRWQVEVRARIGSGPTAVRGDWSRPLSVRLFDPPPRLDVERFDGEYARLNWTGVGASYELEWGERGGAKRLASRDGRSPTLELGPLEAGKTYEFRVRARSRTGHSDYSPTASFTPVAWRGPRPGAAYVARLGQLYSLWFPQQGAEWYELGWINGADPSERARVRVGTATSGGRRAQVPGQIGRAGGFENGLWQVRVRAGPWGVWSPIYPLTLANLPERLTLELESSRELCTAGTLTEISWEISGGTAPYALTVEGSAVDISADNTRINCGALTEAEAADEDAALAAKRITATVTDSRGVQRDAAIDVARAKALPALMVAGNVWPYADALSVIWDGINTSHCGVAECFVVRWRSVGAITWTVEPFQPGNLRQGLYHYIDELTGGVAYEAAAATIRDRIEIETPDVLNWTTVIQGATLTVPTGLTTTSTHDTITLRWDRQPSAQMYFVFLNGPDGGLRNHLSATDRDTWGDTSSGFHEVVFRNLPTDTEFNAIVASLVASEDGPGLKVQQTVRTQPAPAGHKELPRGPQNLRVTVTDTTITARWDEPFSGAPPGYIVRLYHPSVEKPWLEWVWAPDLAVTFSGLQPDVTYRLSVEQLGPVADPVEVSVATTRPPSGAADAIPPTPLNPEPPPPWPPPFSFVWPHIPKTPAGWAVLTEDAWIVRPGSGYWHAAVDTGLYPRCVDLSVNAQGEPICLDTEAYRQTIQALAPGWAKEYTPESGEAVSYCPGSSASGNPYMDVRITEKNATVYKSTTSDVPCTELANGAHGRVVLTMHRAGNMFYVVQYAHLYRFGSATAFRTAAQPTSRAVAAGETIGLEGGTTTCVIQGSGGRVRTECNEAYAIHLHMTIRAFNLLRARDQVELVKGVTWRTYDNSDAWNCVRVTKSPTYCHGPDRSIATMLDPEEVLPPPPPATDQTGPRGLAPQRGDIAAGERVENDVDNSNKRYVISSVKTSILNDVAVKVDVAIWRPHFYTFPYYEENHPTPVRFTKAGAGVAGTRDGVNGYVVHSDCGSIAWSGSSSKTAFAQEDFWSEVEPIEARLSLRRGRTCVMRQQSYNSRHSVGTSASDAAYGRDALGRAFEPEQLTGQVSMYPQALTPGMSEQTITDETLAQFEFRIYEFEAKAGYEYSFSTMLEEEDDVALELWQDGAPKEDAISQTSGTVTLTWQALKAGTAYLVARGGFINSASLPWTGKYGLRYSGTVRTVCVPSSGGPVGTSEDAVVDGGDGSSTPCRPRPPTALTVTKRTPVRLSLSWTAGTGASFHEMKTTSRANCNLETETFGTPSPKTATSHSFTGLTPGGDYRLCVRSVRTIGSESVKSGWAEITKKTLSKLAAPSVQPVSGITTNSATLNWSLVDDADGYEVKRTEGSGETTPKAASGTTSHPFTGLSPNTPYTFYVRAKLSTNNAVTSAWAEVAATTSPVPRLTVSVSPRSASCYTGGSVSISWTISNGTAPYAVRVNGVSSSGNRKTVTCRSTAGSQTVSVTATDASTPQRSGSANVSLTVRNRPLPPLPPPPIDCLSSTDVSAFATYGRVRSGCLSVWAATLLPAVQSKNSAVCGILRYEGVDSEGNAVWVRYGLAPDGQRIPGSVNFRIRVGNTVYLGPCSSASGSDGVSGASGLEPPICPDAAKPETGPAAIDADASSCATVRSGGALQISRGEYTLNITLASDRDWFAFASANYAGSSAGAFLFLDLTTGGWIALYPPDGSELDRYTPADAPTLPALLDAIAASASPPATE